MSWKVVKKPIGHPTKEPGADGMSTLFYKKYWHIVGNDVISYVLNILNNGAALDQIEIIPILFSYLRKKFVSLRKTIARLVYVMCYTSFTRR